MNFTKARGHHSYVFFFALEEINVLIQKGYIKLIKSHSKDIYIVSIDFHFKSIVLLNFLFKMKQLKQHNLFQF